MWRLLSPVVFDRLSPFYVPDSGSGSGGGNDDDDDDDGIEDPPAPSATGNAATDQIVRDYFENSRRWASRQRKNIGKYRRRAVTAEQALQTERAASEQNPKISADDLKALEAYRKLGKPEELETQIAEGATARTEAVTLKRDGVLREAAQIHGFNFDVLRDRVGTLDVQIREVEQDGTKVKQAIVKLESGQETDLGTHAQQAWSIYLPALQQADAQGNGSGASNGNGNTQQIIPRQGAPRNTSQATGNLSGVRAAQGYVASQYQGPRKRT